MVLRAYDEQLAPERAALLVRALLHDTRLGIVDQRSPDETDLDTMLELLKDFRATVEVLLFCYSCKVRH